ncbi:UNVERIFIED_CONTAM: hypothetical protein Sindi_1770500 [Sesamum indicum]
MRVFKWTPTFTPSKESSIVPVWVSFPELPAHLFRKEVLFTMASMIGTPLQIDDATLNQSKLSKARACIELDLLKPRLEDFQIQICGATIVQRIEYEDIPHYCSLCKHVGHRDSDCYTEGDAPKPPPRKPRNREMKGKKVAEEVGRGKAVTKEQDGTETTKAFERGESSRYPSNPSNDNIVSVNVANTTGDDGSMGEENSANKMAEGNWIQVGNATMLLQEDSDKGETLVIDATSLKICDPPCLTNCNPAYSAEQLLQELASPARLPRNQFCVDEIPEYLVRNTEEKIRVMKQRSTSCGPRIKTDRIKEKWKKQNEGMGTPKSFPHLRPSHHHQQTARSQHRRRAAVGRRRKNYPARTSTRSPFFDAPLTGDHSHGARVPRTVLTHRQSRPKFSKIALKSPYNRRHLLSRNSPPSLRIAGHHIYQRTAIADQCRATRLALAILTRAISSISINLVLRSTGGKFSSVLRALPSSFRRFFAVERPLLLGEHRCDRGVIENTNIRSEMGIAPANGTAPNLTDFPPLNTQPGRVNSVVSTRSFDKKLPAETQAPRPSTKSFAEALSTPSLHHIRASTASDLQKFFLANSNPTNVGKQATLDERQTLIFSDTERFRLQQPIVSLWWVNSHMVHCNIAIFIDWWLGLESMELLRLV